MYRAKYESVMEKDPQYSWTNLPIQATVDKLLARLSDEETRSLILSTDIALYNSPKVAGLIHMPVSMATILNA